MIQFLYLIIALVTVLTFHEFAHAWTANYLGDPTAKYKGRVSLNPIRHLDLMGTILLFIVGLGWGKPVPVDPRNFRNPVKDGAIVAAAGPLANLVIAFVASIPYKYVTPMGTETAVFVGELFGSIFSLSIILFVFNLLPFPPLDGSKVIGAFIPSKYWRQYQEFLYHGTKYFMIFVLADIFLVKSVLGYSLLWYVLSYVYAAISSVIWAIT